MYYYHPTSGFPGGSEVKNPPAVQEPQRMWLIPGKIAWRRTWQPAPVFLPGESHGQRSLAGHSPWGCKESDKTEVTVHVHTHPVSQMRKLKLQQGKKLVQVTQYRQQSWNPNLNLSDSTPIF